MKKRSQEFNSFLSPQIKSFIAYRKASDNWNDVYEWILHRFDDYCSSRYPDSTALSQEMVDNWCKQRNTEINNTCITRNHAVVGLIKYLSARGKTDVNLPILPQSEHQTYIPHAFTEQEINDFFNACDNISCNNDSPQKYARKITLPVLFRLLYSSGIRTTEARLLRREDVDLQNGVLDIQFSKGYDQHYVVLHESTTDLLRRYDTAIGKVYPNRKYFFPAHNGAYQSRHWLTWNFRQIWGKVSTARAVPYDFRHNYAIKNINKWINTGFDFDDKLLYLSKSMGHRDIESTKYYYSLVPGLADILEEKTNADFEDIVPEVCYEEI